MEKNKLIVPIRKIAGNEDDHCFFGYYDIPAFSGDGNWHLYNEVSFMHRNPRENDVNSLYAVNLQTNEKRKIGETLAWNFQQGSFLQWYPSGSSMSVFYNAYEEGEYCGYIQKIADGSFKKIDMPLAAISPDGHYGVSINFSRVYDFRSGYGYHQIEDINKEIDAPKDDGIFLTDLSTGTTRLLISYEELVKQFPLPSAINNKKVVVNHVTFNPDSNRFFFLLRYFGDGDGWGSVMATSDLAGNVYALSDYTMASHYYWKDATHILIYANAGEGDALYELEDLSPNYEIIAKDYIDRDIHCSYSPNKEFIIGDGYPTIENPYREIFLFHIPTGKGKSIGSLYSDPTSKYDYRCDLHIRWNPNGTHISLDSTHEGFRGLYEIDLNDVLKTF